MMTTTPTFSPTRSQRMHDLITAAISPTYLEIIDESAQHQGHQGVAELKQSFVEQNKGTDRPESAINHPTETHFSLKISADALNGLSRIKQHQMIYDAIAVEFKTGLHSLRIDVIPSGF